MFSYVVARDYGFAPNPFHGYCTLATCKPDIRRDAQVGDLVVGLGSATKGVQGHLVYVMIVTETMTFSEYWNDQRFQCKRPSFSGNLKQAYGDNIYTQRNGGWFQANSHHSFADGTPNPRNIANDTSADRVLISDRYIYWGDEGPMIPQRFRNFEGEDICLNRGYKRHFPAGMREAFEDWVGSLGARRINGRPGDWPSYD